MKDVNLGDLVLIEIALVHFFKDVDISMYAGQQISEIIGKIEILISKLKAEHADKQPDALNLPNELNPHA